MDKIEDIQAFIDLESEVNAMTLTYTSKLGIAIR